MSGCFLTKKTICLHKMFSDVVFISCVLKCTWKRLYSEFVSKLIRSQTKVL